MKKFSLLFVMMLAIVVAMAQTATVSQTGDANNADVDQTGAGNHVTVNQIEATTSTPIGVRNANVTQFGLNNQATIYQEESAGGNHGTLNATMIQLGNSNVGNQSSTAPNYNSGQNLYLKQDGENNHSTQTISRGYTNSFSADIKGNENETEQTMSANHSHGDIVVVGHRNDASQDLSGSNHGYHKNITTEQTGDDNSAKQMFTGSGLGHVQKGTIIQTGDWNTAMQKSDGPDQELIIEQTGGNNNVASQDVSGNDQFTSIVQKGSGNFANTKQTGGSNTTSIRQIGDDNVIGLKGTVDAIGAEQNGIENKLDVLQQGNRNIVTQYRPEKDVYSSIKQVGERNEMDIDQIGHDNVVGLGSYPYDGIDQNNNDNYASIQQMGNSNKVGRFYQKGSENSAYITQDGNGNEIKAASQKLLGSEPAGNSLILDQLGNDNTIEGANEEGKDIIGSVLQQGNDNRAYLQLSRTSAFGDIDQIGEDNDASLTINKTYIGEGNKGVIAQTGNGNKGTEYVGQTDPATTSANNAMSITQSGDLNVADIWLEGSFNNATIHQTLTIGANASISQMGNNNTSTISQQ